MRQAGFNRGKHVVSVGPSAHALEQQSEYCMAWGALPEATWSERLAGLDPGKMLGDSAEAASLMP